MRPFLLVIGLALLVAPAQAAPAEPAASGGWRGDAPGVMHHITAADLPAPYASPSVADGAKVVARPRGVVPRVPPGFTVSLWAEGLDEPRAIRRAPDGSIFVAESGAGRVLRFTPDGQRATFADRLDQPFGIAFWPPAAPRYVYIAETGRIVRFPWEPGTRVRRDGPRPVIPELPTGGHWTRDLAVAADGSRLFVSVGSASNVAQGMRGMPPGGIAAWQEKHGIGAAWGAETERAAVLWFRPDGAGGLHPFAQGLRNCSGLAVEPENGTVWCATNERDGLGDNLPPDYATHLVEGGFYGWPWFYIGPHPDKRTVQQRPDLAEKVIVPDVLIEAHSAPLGIAFYDGTLFPPEWRGAFVALHGSWNRAPRTGYKVVRLPMKDGRASGEYQDFMTGFVLSDSTVWGRPVDAAVTADGALLVTEDGNGTIWRVAPR